MLALAVIGCVASVANLALFVAFILPNAGRLHPKVDA